MADLLEHWITARSIAELTSQFMRMTVNILMKILHAFQLDAQMARPIVVDLQLKWTQGGVSCVLIRKSIAKKRTRFDADR
jgi:hypothetical protein